ncbi:MAG: hypothetical protein QW343_03525 [Candidatus Norongarragalinales archaeon]
MRCRVKFLRLKMAQSPASDLAREIPHIIVLVILILVLLVVVTKFNWVHCSQIPGNWCDIYCNVIMRTHSRIALVYGEDGIGDPEVLENIIRRIRPYAYLEPVRLRDASYGMLKGYDLVILERARSISFKESRALREYLNKGGMMIWVGDSASRHYYDQVDVADVLARTPDEKFNESGLNKSVLQRAFDHEMSVDELDNFTQKLIEKGFFGEEARTRPKGFGPLQDVLLAKFVGVVNAAAGKAPATLKIVNRQNVMAKGLSYEFAITPTRFAEVKENAAGVDKVALISFGGREYTGIFETRYAGRVVYSAVPLEDLNSTTLLSNILDYLVTC